MLKSDVHKGSNGIRTFVRGDAKHLQRSLECTKVLNGDLESDSLRRRRNVACAKVPFFLLGVFGVSKLARATGLAYTKILKQFLLKISFTFNSLQFITLLLARLHQDKLTI